MAVARIIAGQAGGVRLTTPRGATTRPTTDRVREALFAALATWTGGAAGPASEQLQEVDVLDLFAGSGALGLEAASRGARRVVWVERDRAACAVIERNRATAGLDGRVVVSSVGSYLDRPAGRPFDVLLLDPPYVMANEELAGLLDRAATHGFIAPDGLVVVERDARSAEPQWPFALTLGWSRRYGESCLYFCRPRERA